MALIGSEVHAVETLIRAVAAGGISLGVAIALVVAFLLYKRDNE